MHPTQISQNTSLIWVLHTCLHDPIFNNFDLPFKQAVKKNNTENILFFQKIVNFKNQKVGKWDTLLNINTNEFLPIS